MALPKPQRKPFAHYARVYDLLYGGKDYVAEAQFVHERLQKLGVSGGDLLELGCGTGRHAVVFASLDWNVTGVDLSPGMIAQAKQRAARSGGRVRKKLSFRVGDMAKVSTGKTHDAVVSLFHVMGYQTSNRALADSLRTAANHLARGGLFFFDFWFGPAVLTDRPSVRVKRFEDEQIGVTRISEPTIDVAQNVVSIDFDVLVEEKRTGTLSRIKENHRVRYFFLPELEQCLDTQGFQVVGNGKWMSTDPLDQQSWYGWIAARRR